MRVCWLQHERQVVVYARPQRLILHGCNPGTKNFSNYPVKFYAVPSSATSARAPLAREKRHPPEITSGEVMWLTPPSDGTHRTQQVGASAMLNPPICAHCARGASRG